MTTDDTADPFQGHYWLRTYQSAKCMATNDNTVGGGGLMPDDHWALVEGKDPTDVHQL